MLYFMIFVSAILAYTVLKKSELIEAQETEISILKTELNKKEEELKDAKKTVRTTTKKRNK